jgi:predicted TIM-barrel fold metal-dependent hydrolase
MAALPPLFDASKYLGTGFPEDPDFPTARRLLAHLDRLGIDRALAWHTEARGAHPMPGNEQLVREIAAAGAQERLIPAFAIAPSLLADHGAMAGLMDLATKHRARAFRIWPKDGGWSLGEIAPVLQALLPLKPVLFLEVWQGVKKEGILDLAARFPQVPIVYANLMWPHLPDLYEMMEARPNVYIETGLLHTYRGIEYLIHRFGAERIIFGAGYRSNNGAFIATLANAAISPEQADLVAHGNLERLLGMEPRRGTRPVEGDRLWHRLLRREALGVPVVDAHTHLPRTASGWDHRTDFDAHVKDLLGVMDRLGVETTIVAGMDVAQPDSLEGNTYLEEHMQPYLDRFRGYFGFHPESAEKLAERLDDFFSRPFYVGFKLLNDYWRIPVTDPRFAPMWEYAEAHALPVLIHTWNSQYNAPRMLRDIAPRYPNAILLLGHSGASDRPDAEQLVVANPNVYLEWCGSFTYPVDWKETLERVGTRRLVYGSDATGHDPAWEMGRLLSLDLPDDALRPILGENMQEILARRR